MLSLRKSNAAACTPRASRRTTMRVTAWKGDNNLFAGLLRMFTPSKYINTKEDWTATGTPFSGRINHDRKPFNKDGYVATAKPDDGMQKLEEEGEGVLEYLNTAAERVVGHNFKGEPTEPDWKQMGERGWKGDVRRGRDQKEKPFHSTKY